MKGCRLDRLLPAARHNHGDYLACKDPSTVALLKELGIHLTGWKDVLTQ